MVKFVKVFSILLLVVGWVSFSEAAPVISSVSVPSSNEMVLSGSGFGNKAPAAPLLWETFENGSAGSLLSADNKWPAYNYRDGAKYSNDQSYSGSLSAHNRVTPTSGTSFDTNNFFFSPTDEVYYSYRSKFISSGDSYGQFKNGRSNADSNKYNGPGNIYFSADASNYEVAPRVYGGTDWHSGLRSPNWTRHEIYKKNSTPGVANGAIWMAIGGNVVRDEPASLTRMSGQSFKQTNIILGLMYSNAKNDGDHRMWVDDVYVDNTRARVELCDASQWSSRTECEPQIPSAWSPTSVNVSLNRGGFNSGDRAYLYVVDQYGNVNSNGYAVTIAESGGSTVPVAPPASGGGSFSFQQDNYIVDRSDGFAYFTISRLGSSDGTASVQWTSNGVTAFHNVDYYGADNVTVNFADGETSKQVAIELIQNDSPEDRMFNVSLANASGGASLGAETSATITIEGALVPPPRVWVQ